MKRQIPNIFHRLDGVPNENSYTHIYDECRRLHPVRCNDGLWRVVLEDTFGQYWQLPGARISFADIKAHGESIAQCRQWKTIGEVI